MLELRVIVKSRSAWSSHLAVVFNSSGSVRLCLDVRNFNKVIVKDTYYIPIVDGLLRNFKQIKIYNMSGSKES